MMLEDLEKLVSDPTDFPSHTDAPGLRQLDSAFRCGICGEIFDGPMMLPCGHSFCSLCARESLRERHECPQCRNSAEELHLMKNVALEDLGVSWRLARDFILRLLDRVVKHDNFNLKVNGKDGSIEDPSRRPQKRRKISSDAQVTPKANQRGLPLGVLESGLKDSSRDKREEVVMELIEDSEEELRPDYIPSSDTEENEYELDQDKLVPCPLCARKIRFRHANGHIDSGCLSYISTTESGSSKATRTDTKHAWNDMFSGPSGNRSKAKGKGKETQKRSALEVLDSAVERLPKPSYNVLKDKKLREMLSEHDLSSTGTRDQLIARHNHYVLLFNANLDRAEQLRKPVSELRRDLKKWEESMAVKKTSVDDGQGYMKTHNVDFKSHIEAAKASAVRKQSKSVPASPGLGPPRVEGSHGVVRKLPKQTIEETVVADSEGEI